MKHLKYIISFGCILLSTCTQSPAESHPVNDVTNDSISRKDTLLQQQIAPTTPPLTKEEVVIVDSLLYDQHTLKDNYKYQDISRSFKREVMKDKLALVENMQESPLPWGVIQNYKNRNGEAPLVRHFNRNKYRRVADSLGTERYQSAPFYALNDTLTPVIYGRDGNLVHICGETGKFYKIETIGKESWYIPKRYVLLLAPDTKFRNVVFVDRKDQNIATLEWAERGKWLIRSKNPATTGRYKPPYASPTPLGIFLIQEKKQKMRYLKDGSAATGGYAPYASRFTCGAYIHGVPVNVPHTAMIEYSWSLGTIPRSHMCVRNATSHAKFIYEWAKTKKSLVIVIE